ncbi:MAG: EamA family transporter [Chloroflexi bacterium]|nr:EamA family transporter [Chloroflexota bacterium]MBT3670175.1 EamA family transporter [Chloroflexota bacterium]MBT4004045.1 EamA family transporter [Chloroflexota bacterium]MBT4306151.1 EamA family transporter [Chloroflexota bacterium]MBT4534531.1 EamA family transporter [Chloroflexota bacterium]
MNFISNRPKAIAIFQALFVTFLWSTSWVLIKEGLKDLPPLTFAGLRYLLAFLILIPVYLRQSKKVELKRLTKNDWGLLITLGIVYYTLTQGLQFLGLKYLPAITFSLLLNFTALFTAVLALIFLKEKLSNWQWVGILVFLAGVFVYFYPLNLPVGLALGLAIGMATVFSNSIASIIGRFINRSKHLDPLTVTVVSMGIGAILLFTIGLLTEEWQPLSLTNWGNIFVLAAINTAFAFTLWNHTLRTISATESSLINNTMLIQIAILAWLFLGEQPSIKEWLGMAIVGIGVIMVTLQRKRISEGE